MDISNNIYSINIPVITNDSNFNINWNPRILFSNVIDVSSFCYGIDSSYISNPHITKFNTLSPLSSNDIFNPNTYNLLFESKYNYVDGAYNNNGTIYNKFYKKELESLLEDESRLINCEIFLTEDDILNLDFSKPVYIENKEIGNAYYKINSITYKSNDFSKVELIKINYFAEQYDAGVENIALTRLSSITTATGTSTTSGVISGGTTVTYSLPIASATILGGIKVGTGLSINSTTGVLITDSSTSGLTRAQIDASYATNASVNLAIYSNASLGLANNSYATNASVNLAFIKNASLGLVFNQYTNVSLGLAFNKNTNASLGFAFNQYTCVSLGLASANYATNASVNTAFRTNASLGLAVDITKNVSLGIVSQLTFVENTSIGNLITSLNKTDTSLYKNFLTNVSLGLAFNQYTNASLGLANNSYATNASVGLAFLTNVSLGLIVSTANFSTNASVNTAFLTNVSLGLVFNQYTNASLGLAFNQYTNASLGLAGKTYNLTIKAKTTNYSLVLDDNNRIIECDASITIFFPGSAFFTGGEQVVIVNTSTGYVTLSASTGASAPYLRGKGTKIINQYSAISAYYDDVDNRWTLIGDLT